MADKYDAFLDAPDTPAVKTVDKYDAFLDAPVVQSAPTAVPVATPAPVQPVTPPVLKQGIAREIAGGVAEPLLKMGTSMVAKPVSEVMGIAAMFSDYLQGNKDGDPVGFQRAVQESLTYQPRTTMGASKYNPLNAIPEAVGSAMSAVGTPIKQAIQGDNAADTARGMAANFVGEAVPQALGIMGVKKAPSVGKYMSESPVRKLAAKQAASSADWQRAAVIDAAKIARENKIIMNPSSVAGKGHNVKMAMAGGSTHFDTAASIANKSKWNDMVRQDLGVGKDVPLTAKTYDMVRKAIAKPYDDATSLGPLSPNKDAIAAIREIEIPEILPAGEQAAGKMKRVTDLVADQLESGMTGKDAVSTTRTLRKEAKSVFDSVRSGSQVDATTLETAKAKMRIAEKIDETISSNISDPAWKSAFDNSRRKMAQSYAYERATNLVRQQVDPQVFAQEMQGRHYLTGNAVKMGEIAGNFPEIANVYAERGKVFGMPVRSGPVGTAGFAIGSLYGAPVATSATAAALASMGEKLYGKRLRGEAAQAKYAVPVDRRMPIPENGLLTGTQP